MAPPPAMAPMTIMELPCACDSAVGQIQGIWLHTILYFCIILGQEYHQAHTQIHPHIFTHLPTGRVSNSCSALWLLGWPSGVKVWTRNTYLVPGKRSLISMEFLSNLRTLYVVTSWTPLLSFMKRDIVNPFETRGKQTFAIKHSVIMLLSPYLNAVHKLVVSRMKGSCVLVQSPGQMKTARCTIYYSEECYLRRLCDEKGIKEFQNISLTNILLFYFINTQRPTCT